VHLHEVLGARALLVGLGLGVVTGLASGALTSLVYACEDWFGKLPVHWMWWPAIGALFVGIGGVIDPRVLGVGYETIHSLMRGEMIGTAVLTLVVAKSVVWSIALGSGTSGGVLAPLLMVGGALGAYIAGVTGIADPSLCAMIGMAAMMGGTMRAPLTGMIFVLELTHDLNALPVLLIGSVAAVCVTVLLLRRSILTEKLARRGQHVVTEYAVDVFELARVGDVMDRNVPVAPVSVTVAELSDRIARGDQTVAHRQATLLVGEDGALAGIVTRGDLMRALQEENAKTATALSAGAREVIVAYPDEPLQDAVAKMLKGDVGRLPVVSRDDRRKVLGYLGRADILAARSKWHEEEERREKAIALRPKRA
jgi:CBS domain-containing protein